ncbi:MAG: AgmX/PglI C-terminal domain-containing protein [Bradymonadaceae bacterium]
MGPNLCLKVSMMFSSSVRSVVVCSLLVCAGCAAPASTKSEPSEAVESTLGEQASAEAEVAPEEEAVEPTGLALGSLFDYAPEQPGDSMQALGNYDPANVPGSSGDDMPRSPDMNEQNRAGASRQPRMVPGRPRVEGELDRELVREVVRVSRREIITCYETELEDHPELHGLLHVKFVIGADGAVVGAEIGENSLENDELGACVAAQVSGWVFPAVQSGGNTVVDYPFNFSTY